MDFPSLSSTNSDFELTLSLISIRTFCSSLKHVLTLIFLNSEVRNFCLIYNIASKIELHQSTAASTWWRGPKPLLGWVEMAVGLSEVPEVPSYLGYSPYTNLFSRCCPLDDRRGLAHSFFKIVRLSSLFSCLSLARLLILLRLLMSGNVHPNPCPCSVCVFPCSVCVFPCSVCAGNLTWRGTSVQ